MLPLAAINKLTLDQVLLFVSVAEAGSFSGAARQLDRVQSTVSHGIAQLETELALKLFDRSYRKPQLTPAGQHLLPQARALLTQVRHFQAEALRLSEGQEASVSVVLDMIIPLPVITQSLRALQTRFPAVQWLIHTEMLSAITQRISEGSSQIGLTGILSRTPAKLVSQAIGKVDFVYVVSSQHALAQNKRPSESWIRPSRSELERHTQLGVADRSANEQSRLDTSSAWQFADLSTLVGFVMAAQGWAYLPLHLVWPELKSGSLKLLWPLEKAELVTAFTIYSIRLESEQPGPVRQALIEAFAASFQRAARQVPDLSELRQLAP